MANTIKVALQEKSELYQKFDPGPNMIESYFKLKGLAEGEKTTHRSKKKKKKVKCDTLYC